MERWAHINYEKKIYSEYLKYNGNGNLLLSTETVYKVVTAKIFPYYTQLTVMDVDNGKILEGINSCCFKPIKGYCAIAQSEPKVGKRADVIRINSSAEEMQMEKVMTSKVLHIDVIAENMYAIITQNSVYVII